MRRLLVSAVIAAAALALPATAASASDPLPVGANGCPYPQKGVVLWHWDAKSGYTYVWACV
jgi:hypothetical protein